MASLRGDGRAAGSAFVAPRSNDGSGSAFGSDASRPFVWPVAANATASA
ncbi:hypothetical protein ACSNOI_11940 [Actinomadura kijaniata]